MLQSVVAFAIALPIAAPMPLLFKTVVLVCYVTALVLVLRKDIQLHWLTAPLAPLSVSYRARLFWPVAGLFLLGGMLTFLEWRQPFYFTQDDNHVQFLPVITRGLHDLLAYGIFPTWNGFQLFGIATASVGVYGFTYPVIYVAYGIARWLLGNELLLIEVYATLHLAVGYGLTYGLLRRGDIRPSIASIGALCCILSGFNLMIGRCWYFALPLTVLLPVLLMSLQELQKHACLNRRWTCITALTSGIVFHAGQTQLWLYAMLFWGLAALWITLFSPKNRVAMLASIIAAGLFSLAIAMPLLYTQLLEFIDLPNQRINDGIGVGLNNVLLPLPLEQSPHPSWGIQQDFMGGMYFFGAIFFIAWLLRTTLELAHVSKNPTASRHIAPTFIYSAVTVVALWWSFGKEGLLWTWIAHIPPFNGANSPFKLLPIIIIFSTVAGATFVERILRTYPLPRITAPTLALCGVILLTINATAAKWPWIYLSDTPYPPLPESLKILQTTEDFSADTARILSYTQWRSHLPNYVHTLAQNYPSYYRIIAAHGYDKNTAYSAENEKSNAYRQNNLKQYIEAYGIRAAIIGGIPDSDLWKGERHPFVVRQNEREVKVVASLPHQTVDINGRDHLYMFTLPATKPLVYTEHTNQVTALPFRIRPNGLEIKPPNETSDEITVNFLFRNWFVAWNEKNEQLAVSKDKFERIVIKTTAKSGMIRLIYQPPWHYGFFLGLMLGVIALATYRISKRAG